MFFKAILHLYGLCYSSQKKREEKHVDTLQKKVCRTDASHCRKQPIPVRNTIAFSISGHHVPGMQNRVLMIIQVMNHKIHMEYKYLKTLLGNPTPLLGQIYAYHSLRNNQKLCNGYIYISIPFSILKDFLIIQLLFG